MAVGEPGGRIRKQGWITGHSRVVEPEGIDDYNGASNDVAVADSSSSLEESAELEREALEWCSDSSNDSNDINGDREVVMDKVWWNITTCNLYINTNVTLGCSQSWWLWRRSWE